MRQSDNGPTYEFYCSTHDYYWIMGEDGFVRCSYCEAEFIGQEDHADARDWGIPKC